MRATREEMDLYELPLGRRDHCAHLWIRGLQCIRKSPNGWQMVKNDLSHKCHHEILAWEHCERGLLNTRRRDGYNIGKEMIDRQNKARNLK